MGIDAEMFVKLNNEISEEELKKKSYIFGSMFKYNLCLGHKEEVWSKPLQRVDKIEGDGSGPDYEFYSEVNKPIIKIPLSGRYYGIGYERGPLMTYIQIAMFLEYLFPNCEIFYGGDSSGIPFTKFDSAARAELITHAINNGHDPYNRYFDKENDGPICPVCDVKMIRSGWGNKYSYWSCLGCGWFESNRDGKVLKGFGD